jgi:hypothetical protein
MVDGRDISAVGFVKEKGSQDEGSGTLQIYDWCDLKKRKKRKANPIDDAQVWINDVCRNIPQGVTKSVVSPVSILFILFEQLVAYNLSKSEIYLMVEKHESGVLIPIYSLNYGFVQDDSCFSPGQHICMRKDIIKDPNFAVLPILQIGGINKKIRKNKKTKSKGLKKNMRNKKYSRRN